MNRILLRNFSHKLVLSLFILSSIYFLICGKFGILEQFNIKQEFYSKKLELVELEQEVLLLDKKLKDRIKDDFYIEKIAREDLGMGYPGETLFLKV